ncbi:class I SAM-dependent methyltransferase [Plastoroseomonas hellenica]|uniref:class I SAM-dependent methyltransferase n=1 Tax=Plastoroseomonas hellenica TaxID=2687306 RepID=UPI001BACC00F|nr:class I SAM-dependent methyltransferase [Plastoroseomonas hellenica]MBR0644690.1 class I SAM-dependent methyltransferase [Plastoroseomonas hellenica]
MDAAEYALMDTVEDRMWWYRALRARIVAALAARPGAPGPVLDAGCGTGGMLAALRAAGVTRPLAGFDFMPEAARRARAKTGAPVAVGDITHQPFSEARFGAVISLDVLSHAAVDPGAALAEIFRVLVPGGTLILNLPAFDWLKSAHDARVHNARRFTAGGIRAALAAAGFGAIETRYWNALLLPMMIVQRKLLARGPDAASDVAAFPPWLDATLHGVTVVEHGLARLGLRYPAGGSILAVATRP